jgi:hypothetical protein
LAGCTVTVHEHLDGRISVRYGPHLVANWGKDDASGTPTQRGGKGGSLEAGENQKQVSSGFHPPLESRLHREIPTFPRADDYGAYSQERKNKSSLTGQIVCE